MSNTHLASFAAAVAIRSKLLDLHYRAAIRGRDELAERINRALQAAERRVNELRTSTPHLGVIK